MAELVFRYATPVAFAPPTPAWTPPPGVAISAEEPPKVTEIRLADIVSQATAADGSVTALDSAGVSYTVPTGFLV